MARRGQVVLARAMNETGATSGPRPARERQRLITALAAFSARPTPADPAWPAGPGFGMVAVSEACSACGACARACPTGALQFERVEPDGYRLLFHAARCTGCEACLHGCAPAALSVDNQPTFAAIFDHPAPAELSAGRLVRCASCHTWMAAASGKQFCPTCEVRRGHPFGPRPIPGRAKVHP
jgi:ferredoxin